MNDDATRRRFETCFGDAPDLVVRSPGRVNLIGEHTDYNDGWVLPAAINWGTDVAARRSDDGLLCVETASRGFSAAEIDATEPPTSPNWCRYVWGFARLLREVGVELPGARLYIDGDLPIGTGLSSSASMGLGVCVALLAVAGASLDPIEIAKLGQRVENECVGVASGIMDQLAVACATKRHALLIDCRSLALQQVPIPDEFRLVVLDSAIRRNLVESRYNERRDECARALSALQQLDPELRALRDVSPALLASAGHILDPTSERRARHVVSENQRVLDAVDALRRGDAQALGAQMIDSHASLRDEYEVSCPELDVLVEIALETDGVQGARLTGAGFGGCAVAVVDARFAEGAARRIVSSYRNATGRDGSALLCETDDHVRVM